MNVTYSGSEVCAIKNKVELNAEKKILTLLESCFLILLLIDFLRLQYDPESQMLFISLSDEAK